MVQQRQHSVASGWSRACREGWRRFLSLWSHASWQNRACKVCATSKSHPFSFFVHLHLNSAGLWLPKQFTSQKSTERSCYLLDNQRLLIYATVAFSFVLIGGVNVSKAVSGYKSHIMSITDIQLWVCSYKSNHLHKSIDSHTVDHKGDFLGTWCGSYRWHLLSLWQLKWV